MIILLSPSKTMDMSIDSNNLIDIPLKNKTKTLVKTLNKYSLDDICKIMKLKEDKGEEVLPFYKNFYSSNGSMAIHSYNGSVFKNIDIPKLKKDQLSYLYKNVVILSALYGDLSPRDYIKEYRLDMTMKIFEDKNLYNFWGEEITDNIIKRVSSNGDNIILNLASNEFSKLISRKRLKEDKIRFITISFKEERDGKYKVIGTYAKKARGLMVGYLSRNNIDSLDGVKKFNLDRYTFNNEISKEDSFVFTRGEE